uniref:AraC family transcriptional regulator n=1 Tax=Burkholderia anthina TaxID=179879 RepID=UPI001589B9E2|nr:AraC family transcriptional regulator [Burkholderia anthina]
MRRENDSLAELQALIRRHAVSGESGTAFPGLILSAYTLPTQPELHWAEPAFALIAQGAKDVVLGDEVYRYATGQYLVYSVDLPLSSRVVSASQKEPVLGLGFRLNADKVAALLLEAGLQPKDRGRQRSIAVSNVDDALLDPVVRLLRLLDHPKDLFMLADAIEREILWRLINGEQGALVRQLGFADGRTMQISRAIKWIRVNYARVLRIQELADVACMSVTSFHRHFAAVTSLSPIQFQRQVRLQVARTLLLSSAKTVADIGLEVGYDSPSQFSREYRRQFGRPPRVDGDFLKR